MLLPMCCYVRAVSRSIDLPVDLFAPTAGLNITACRSAMCRAENVRVDGGLLRLQSDRDPSDSSRRCLV